VQFVAYDFFELLLSTLNLFPMNKYWLFFLPAIIALSAPVYGQNQKVVDSLYSVLETQSGGERFLALYDLTFEYLNSERSQALSLIRQAEAAALLTGDSLWIVKSKRVKGQLLYLLERSLESQSILYEVLQIARRNNFAREQSYTEIILGTSHLYVGNYDKALKHYFDALALSEALDDEKQVGAVYHNIGVAYYKIKDYRRALDYYLESYRIYRANDAKTVDSYLALSNISLCYAHLGDFSSARISLAKSMQGCKSDCSDRLSINIEYSLGLIAYGEGKYDAAALSFLKSYSRAKENHDTRFQFDNIYLLTEIYLRAKHFQKAEELLLEAEKLISAGASFNLEIIKIYSRFSQLYLATQDYKKASVYQFRYIQLKDSIYNEELTTNLMRVQAEFMERENAAKIAGQAEVLRLNQEVIRHQRGLNIASGFLMAAVATILVFLLKNYREKRTLNILLEKKVKERTLELELNHDCLQRTINEADLRLCRLSRTIASTKNTIAGLCCTAAREISEPLAQSYLERIHMAIDRLGK
jgi:tetratricopeptide (TPR) repeat protein